MQDDIYLTVEEVAKQLRVSQDTVRRGLEIVSYRPLI